MNLDHNYFNFLLVNFLMDIKKNIFFYFHYFYKIFKKMEEKYENFHLPNAFNMSQKQIMSQFELLTMRINILEKLVKKEKLLNDLKSLINEHIQNEELNENIKDIEKEMEKLRSEMEELNKIN